MRNPKKIYSIIIHFGGVGIKFIWTNGVLIDLEVNHTICEQFWFDNMYKCLRNTCIDLRLDYISLLKKKKIETLGFNLV